MSAEKKRSKGAPFWICAKKLPLEPYAMASLASDCFSYCEPRSARANCRSEAAAMRRDWACALQAPRKKRRASKIAALGRSNAAPLHCRIVRTFFMGARTHGEIKRGG